MSVAIEAEALSVLREMLAKCRSPLYPSECDGSLSCFFCNAGADLDGNALHEPDCPWPRAKALIRSASQQAD